MDYYKNGAHKLQREHRREGEARNTRQKGRKWSSTHNNQGILFV